MRIIKKTFKKLYLFFLSNPVPFNGQNYQKRGLELVTTVLKVTKQIHKISCISYVLSDQVRCNVQQVLSYSKNYIGKFI